MITEAMIKQVKYPPELLPDAWIGDVPANAEYSPPILDIKNFAPFVAMLSNIQLTANANVELRARYDDIRVNENTAAMLSALVGAWRLPALRNLYFNFFGVGAAPAYTTFYGVWAFPPTIAHKLFWGLSLTDAEQAIVKEFSIDDTVEKGQLPMPISQLIEREYAVVGEETHSRSININAANAVFNIESLVPRTDEIVVLTRIAAAPSLAAQNIRLIIDRDRDKSFLTIPTFPLSLVQGGELACFVPATTEIQLTCIAAVAPGPELFRYTFQRVKLNNILRLRFGLITEADLPAKAKDLARKVQGGIV